MDDTKSGADDKADTDTRRRDTSGERGPNAEPRRRRKGAAQEPRPEHRPTKGPDVHASGDSAAPRGLISRIQVAGGADGPVVPASVSEADGGDVDGLTHASFFSGVGGLDLGLERAGWRTVSFSEIDPYASAVLAERWPDVPNLGDIQILRRVQSERTGSGNGHAGSHHLWPDATLWTGGFPCQDLSVAGKRRGLAGERSGLAFAFFDLVRAANDAGAGPEYILLENVPGLLSSHAGRDFYTLQRSMVELGYGVAWRVADARHFGVPQRRRRVFVVGVKADGRAGAERAAAILAVGTRCRRHPATGHEAGAEPSARVGVGISHALSVSNTTGRLDSNGETCAIGPSPDPGGVRAPDGLPGRMDDREDVAVTEDDLLPQGLDSHRYRCCGNGVVSNVAEWLGWRIRQDVER